MEVPEPRKETCSVQWENHPKMFERYATPLTQLTIEWQKLGLLQKC